MPRKTILLATIILLAALTVSCSEDPEPVGPPLEGKVFELASEFVDFLVAENYSDAVTFFSAEMNAAMPEGELQQAWEDLLDRQGSYVGKIEMFVERYGDFEAVNVYTDFNNGPINIRVVFDIDNRVAGLWFRPVD